MTNPLGGAAPGSLDLIRGLVFVQPATGEPFGVIRDCQTGSEPRPVPLGWRVFADDEGGNAFVLAPSGAVAFWDHETEAMTRLADSWDEFVEGCKAPEPVELRPGQVKSVWVDPEFARKMGLDRTPE